jgi:hypothetical protein
MKSTATLEKIIREEIARIRKEQLLEYYIDSRVPEDGYTPKKPWGNSKLEKALQSIGAKPYPLGLNPHGYELDVTFKNKAGATGQDRLWFYDNGEVWSTNQTRTMHYTPSSTTAGAIKLWKEQGDWSPENVAGEIKKQGSKAIFFIAGEANKKEKQETETGLDTFQTVLDWAGMVPVIGDAIDIINGAIYFARGKWFDGLLSMIAVIPVVGSAIKMSVKGIYRGAKLDKLVGAVSKTFKTKNTAELWTRLVKDGAITRDQLQYVGSGLETLTNVLGKARPTIKTIPGSDFVLKELDDFADWMKSSRKSIDDLSTAGAKGAQQVSRKIGQLNKGVDAAKAATGVGSKLVRKISGETGSKMFSRIRKLSWFPTDKLLKLGKAVELRFAREMATPNRLTGIIKTSDPNILRKIVSDPKQAVKLQGLNSNNLRRYLEVIQKKNPKKFEAISSNITDYAKANDNIVWSMYKTDNVKNIRALASKDMAIGGIFKNLDLSLRKNADIIYNELSDLGDEIGLTPDNPNGVVAPIILGGLNSVLPGKKKIQDYVKDAKENPMVASALEAGGYVQNAETGEIQKKSELDYDPTKTATGNTAGGKYK